MLFCAKCCLHANDLCFADALQYFRASRKNYKLRRVTNISLRRKLKLMDNLNSFLFRNVLSKTLNESVRKGKYDPRMKGGGGSLLTCTKTPKKLSRALSPITSRNNYQKHIKLYIFSKYYSMRVIWALLHGYTTLWSWENWFWNIFHRNFSIKTHFSPKISILKSGSEVVSK